jgi:hypothetical protein
LGPGPRGSFTRQIAEANFAFKPMHFREHNYF